MNQCLSLNEATPKAVSGSSIFTAKEVLYYSPGRWTLNAERCNAERYSRNQQPTPRFSGGHASYARAAPGLVIKPAICLPPPQNLHLNATLHFQSKLSREVSVTISLRRLLSGSLLISSVICCFDSFSKPLHFFWSSYLLLSSGLLNGFDLSSSASAMAQHNRNSPHLSSHLNGSTPSSPSMAGAQQQGGPSRQPVSYPSPTSYPSPSIPQAQYNYPPPNNQQVSEPYRASPTGSNSSLSLPSMRSLDPLQQQQQHMGSSLPPPVAQMGAGQYYHNQGQTLPHPQYQHANVTSDPTGQNMRYPLPATDPRVMSGGRHKKVRKMVISSRLVFC
jgi:hypothetical protein